MKKFILTTALLLNAAHLCAMDENQENYKTPKPILIKSVREQHAAFASKVAKHLDQTENALKTDALQTESNIKMNLASAYGNFSQWINLFDGSNKEESGEFIRPLRKLFVEFKEILNHEKISGTADYPASIRYAFPLNLRIQKLADKYCN
jgi:hypothetical protein